MNILPHTKPEVTYYTAPHCWLSAPKVQGMTKTRAEQSPEPDSDMGQMLESSHKEFTRTVIHILRAPIGREKTRESRWVLSAERVEIQERIKIKYETPNSGREMRKAFCEAYELTKHRGGQSSDIALGQ